MIAVKDGHVEHYVQVFIIGLLFTIMIEANRFQNYTRLLTLLSMYVPLFMRHPVQ